MGLPALEELLPIRPPMLWLDEVVELTSGTLRCRLTLRPGQPFVEGGEVDPLVAVEWMTQAAAALAANETLARKLLPTARVLSAIAEARFYVERLLLGDELQISAQQRPDGSFTCIVSRAEEPVASATLRLRDHA